MSADIKCDECGSKMGAADFVACHRCYYKLVRENRELETKIQALVKGKHESGAAPSHHVPARTRGVHNKG